MKKYVSLLLALALVLALFAGCGGAAQSSADTGSAPASASDAEEAAGQEAAPADAADQPADAADSAVEEPAEAEIDTSFLPEEYPKIADGDITLTMLQESNPMMGLDIETYGELPFWQEYCDRTGVQIDWKMISMSSFEEQFYLLIAANDLPNINAISIYYNDGTSTAVEDEVFVNLKDYIEDYAPHYYQLIQRRDVHPVVCDQDDNIIAFYEIADEQFPPNNGVIARGDMLEAQGLEMPVTYDEYEDVLTKLKSAYDLEAPLYYYDMAKIVITAGKGIKEGFSLNEAGEVTYGPVTEGWREYLQIAHDWYGKGLIYQDFFAVPTGQEINYMVQHMSSSASAFTYGYCEFAGMIQLTDPDAYFAPGYLPRENKDDQVHLSDGVDELVGLSRAYTLGPNSTEEEIQTACMMFNYLYTDEGSLFANFGVEGQAFEYDENGEPWYTDLIINNPDGLTQTQALLCYVGYMVPSHADLLKYNISTVTNWADFVEVWATADNKYGMPQVSLTADEQMRYSAAANDVETYMDETITKLIIGDMDINDDAVWDEYVSTMNSLGADEMIEIYQAAYDRFLEG